ncbi:hypothetical protein [Streptomyces sp. SID8352]|uniref:hypothetical protein n=1 Tax=Streptomyces sp. SID8352 TaxID=2690338 RepID=UPI00136E9429|nr:hypothetical protein [Streptomyces sp. SID8352]MYU22716.1 hypothetical protein [Streptomyces sp. SID8352]
MTKSSVPLAVREALPTPKVDDSDGGSAVFGGTLSVACPAFGQNALATGSGRTRYRFAAGCPQAPPVVVDNDMPARRVPPEAVDNCCRMASRKPAFIHYPSTAFSDAPRISSLVALESGQAIPSRVQTSVEGRTV